MAAMAQQNVQEFVGYSIENFQHCNDKPENTDIAFFTYGRFQPGHKGHEKMIMTMLEKAQEQNLTTGTEMTVDTEGEFYYYI